MKADFIIFEPPDGAELRGGGLGSLGPEELTVLEDAKRRFFKDPRSNFVIVC